MGYKKDDSVAKRLQQARVDFQNRKIKKTGKSNRNQYYELADILPNANEILLENGLCTGFFMTEDDMAELTIINVDNLDEEIVFGCKVKSAQLKGVTEAQNYGGSITYCRRYLWLAAFEIEESDLIEKMGTLDERQLVQDTDVDHLNEKIKATKKEAEIKDWAKKKFNIDDLSQLTVKQKEEVEKAIEKSIKKGNK